MSSDGPNEKTVSRMNARATPNSSDARRFGRSRCTLAWPIRASAPGWHCVLRQLFATFAGATLDCGSDFGSIRWTFDPAATWHDTQLAVSSPSRAALPWKLRAKPAIAFGRPWSRRICGSAWHTAQTWACSSGGRAGWSRAATCRV